MKTSSILAIAICLLTSAVFGCICLNDCPTVSNCTSTTNHKARIFDAHPIIYDPAGMNDTLHVSDVDVSDSMEYYNKHVSYPYVPFEFLTYQPDSFPESALRRCPCDNSFAVYDWRILPSEEKAELSRGDREKAAEGSGNAIISLPTFTTSSCFDPSDSLFVCTISFQQFPVTPGVNVPVIGILDTGLDEETLEQMENADLIINSYNLLEPGAAVLDGMGHGTLVTMIAHNAAQGQAKYGIYKTHDDKGYGTVFDIICGLRCALQDNVDIINMSFGGYVKHSALEEELDRLEQDGKIIVIASKGNDGMDTDDDKHIPSDHPYVFDILASDNIISTKPSATGPFTFFVPPSYPARCPLSLLGCSNYSTTSTSELTAALAAPGLVLEGDKRAEGTSFATGYASGLAAALLAANPEMSYSGYKSHVQGFDDDCNKRNGDKHYHKPIE